MHNLPQTEDQTVEHKIVAKGLTAARVTPADLEANITDIRFFTAREGIIGASTAPDSFKPSGTTITIEPAHALLTFCVLTLRNGFTVTGESACASPENFDAEIGKDIAFTNAKAKIWPLMGYALKQRLHDGVGDAPPSPPPSRFAIGDTVSLMHEGKSLGERTVAAIWFGEGKVRYDLDGPQGRNIGIDSCDVEP